MTIMPFIDATEEHPNVRVNLIDADSDTQTPWRRSDAKGFRAKLGRLLGHLPDRSIIYVAGHGGSSNTW